MKNYVVKISDKINEIENLLIMSVDIVIKKCSI